MIAKINADLIAKGKDPAKHWTLVVLVWGSIMLLLIAGFSKPSSTTNEYNDARLYAVSFGQMAIEKTLRDPSSVEWDLKAVNLDNGALCYSYRARNGFGGMVRGRAALMGGKEVGFGEFCPSGANYERY